MSAEETRTRVMGILNVTPDSFSDGGRWSSTEAAVAHGRDLVAQGADIVDVGGESTRPGAERVTPEAEQERVLPVVRALAGDGIRVSVDTMNASTALLARDAGASYINDVSGGLADPGMVAAVIESGLPFIAMHWRGLLQGRSILGDYGDAATEVRTELAGRAAQLVELGVDPARLILDPGLGFSKDAAHNWQILGRLEEFQRLGFPLMIGTSRKRFLGALLPEGASPSERDFATAITSALAAQLGVWAVRVHDVAQTRAALDVVEAWQGGTRA